MEEQGIKNLTKNPIKVTVHWQYTDEVSPAFKRLMVLLLKPVDNQLAETIQADEERQNEQC